MGAAITGTLTAVAFIVSAQQIAASSGGSVLLGIMAVAVGGFLTITQLACAESIALAVDIAEDVRAVAARTVRDA